ncbi:MAG: sulfatase-like hydrolase/transferase [Bacteroidia bacterium]|jgi:hypothetical protein|nr:sulfatase-like hydrolase/transferase [Bacteroidia bacterium]
MLRRKLKLYTYHTFLVVPFIVLFLYAHNLKLSKADMTYRTLFYGTVFCLLLYGLSQVFFRNRLKTGVFVSLLLFGLFQYGVMYELLDVLYRKGLWPFDNIHRYLLLAYAVLFGALLYYFKKTKHDFVRINYFLNFLILILLAFNGGKIVLFHSKAANTNGSSRETQAAATQFKSELPKPDIYYIILDGYASRLTLEKYYKHNNADFYNKLDAMGFKFCDSAYSNYYSTTKSLCATLNARYLSETEDALSGLRNNRVFSLLKENNYNIYHLRSGFVVTGSFTRADSAIDIGGPNEFELSLLKHTALRLDDAFGIFAIQRLQSQFKKMYSMADISARPKFCFMHFVAPHPPFVFEKDGKIRSKHFSDENLWEPEQDYLDQLTYVSTQITKFLSYLQQKNPSAVVILQSDHGPYASAKTAEEIFESRAGILYAYKAPENIKIPDKTSSVNTFPYLFNSLFSAQLRLLKDSTAGKNQFMNNPLLFKKLENCTQR